MQSNYLTASLDNPLYYLENFLTVIRWVGGRHPDLLLEAERERIACFEDLPRPTQALLVRMIMRSGIVFRRSRIKYTELGEPIDKALATAVTMGWLNPNPRLKLDDLFALLTRSELKDALADQFAIVGLRRAATKSDMREALQSMTLDSATFSEWWPDSGDRAFALIDMALFDRVRLMFFGNLNQDWSEFVLTELGHQHYEPVPFTIESRAFQSRTEIDTYLNLYNCRELLDSDTELNEIWEKVPREATTNMWLENHRGRLLFQLACRAEREGNATLAMDAYLESNHREARLRLFRLRARNGEIIALYPLVEDALSSPRSRTEQQGLERLKARLARHLGKQKSGLRSFPALPCLEVRLPSKSKTAVEEAVAMHLGKVDAPVFYVENRLFNALFALLCWRAIYAPLPGSFFHPFHAAPVDLSNDDFVLRRRTLFDEALELLNSDEYRQRIKQTWRNKQGIACPFIHWPTITEELIEIALASMKPTQLRIIFRYLLGDLRERRAGMPDLIQFQPSEQRFRLIEVKAPGDRLQDNQRDWLAYCQSNNIEVAVCYVTWQK